MFAKSTSSLLIRLILELGETVLKIFFCAIRISYSIINHIFILCETNNLYKYSPYEIVDSVTATVYRPEKDVITLELLFAVYFQEMNLDL